MADYYSVPDSDTATGAWTATPLWSKIDESPVVDDADFISSGTLAVPTTYTGTFTGNLNNRTHEGYNLYMRLRKQTATGGQNPTITITIYRGVTTVKTIVWPLTDVTGWRNKNWAFTDAEIAIMEVDLTDLNFDLTASGDAGLPRRSIEISVFSINKPKLPTILNDCTMYDSTFY